jgi:hypothetical protein
MSMTLADKEPGGSGPLVDADPAREAAQLADLQTRQQRGSEPANPGRTPVMLRSLFGQAD